MLKTSFSLKFSTKQLALWGMVLFGVSAHAQLAVNEFNSKRGFTDETGEDVDWIEIFNYATDSVFLADYFLSDNPDNLDKWQFPNTYLGSQELITICASGKENGTFPSHWEALVVAENIWKYWTGSSPPPNYNDWNELGYNDQNWNSGQGGIGYGDNDDNTTIAATPSILMRKEFQIVDVLDITHLLFHADYDDGFIAYLNGVEIMRSDNFANSSPSYNEFTTYDKEAVMYDGGIPESQLFDTDEVQNLLQSGTNVLAVRVHNASANSSDMSSNFFLSAGIASMTINYQSLPTWIQTPLVLPHADFKLSHGETICISDSNEIIVDSVYIPYDITRSISRGRLPDGTGNWCYFNAPSPNESNSQNTCYSGITETPVLDLASGWYSAAQQVAVTTPNNATSYYTTNGDVPDRNDTEVNGPIVIYNTSVLSVR
ncbi:chitobiase/beta-hexosaminidase C-terminal domain-containing protein, partial [Schleiferiaceae bacterium]|nr:chitobiase/beta-hexosaminidase C-terminal domain-containing protein [Schleiferiaceae bacterium]